MLAVQDRTAAQRAAIHAERIERVSAHLVGAVENLAYASFRDEVFARETLAEVQRAYGLWRRCVEERRKDLGR
ncbi:hypothetical protein [Actinacidiphila oryziradicis]|uniref:Uncharacterized protein n=1 Tax=Actinacidiphila oryziradicis TaxID=2571141 RepID=A0A4U0SV77_9ACTN|nr:hypothetical protein [Actinacidiphila oryziradicis]TKA11987.1 hypothetical protein FCI23_09270 [Actinacidiphila oryziradicis]